jgi:D-alanyl-D-alanine carboxypeptidase
MIEAYSSFLKFKPDFIMKINKNTMLIYLLGLILPFTTSSCSKSEIETSPAFSITEFIKNNPNRSSLLLIRNDSVKVNLRTDQKFPLASTVKIIVAIEFAKQVASGKVNPKEMVSVDDLDLYYLTNTDGNAHPNWKKNATERNELSNNKVTLQEVAKGMIWFSSNANTEYLMDKLGLDNINANLKELNLPNHDKVYPVVSSLFLYSNKDKTELSRINQLSPQEYINECNLIHQKLKSDKDGSYKKQFIFPDLTLQKVWSDRLTASTTTEYGSIMQKILGQKYYSNSEYEQLNPILEPILGLSPSNKNIYDYFYSKGGSTGSALTYSLATKTKDGNRTIMAVFFKDLTTDEQTQLQSKLNSFLIDCTQSERYKTIVNGL